MAQPTAVTDPIPTRPDLWPPAWHRGALVGFDLETTGTDPATDRIVTAALAIVRADGAVDPRSRTWLIDPGVEIPAPATAVHGISADHARAHGLPAAVATEQILAALDEVLLTGLPVVVFNAAYDLTLMQAAARRRGLLPLHRRRGWTDACIIDPLVIDREVDRYRPGKRTLQAVAQHYGVATARPHSADGDAVAACLVARAIAEAYPMIGNAEPVMLHRAQSFWSQGWATRFEAYVRSCRDPVATVDGAWPVRAV